MTRTKFWTIRELAIRQCIDAIVIQSKNIMFNNFKDGYQDEMLQELQAGETEFKKLLTVSLLGENNLIQILKYKDSCLFFVPSLQQLGDQRML